jgi:hypothetical protein
MIGSCAPASFMPPPITRSTSRKNTTNRIGPKGKPGRQGFGANRNRYPRPRCGARYPPPRRLSGA